MGISNIRDLEIGYLAGYTYVGNGTLGADDSVYLVDPTVASTVIGGLPIVPADATFGQSYVADVEKHFARKVVHDIRVEFSSLNPSTSNSMVINVGPHRGGDVDGTTAMDTTAANSQAAVMGMQDQMQLASWQSGCLEMRNYIAGGAGSLQNEFDINSAGNTTTFNDSITALAPAGFYVSGSSSTSSLRGTKVHAVIVYIRLSYLDFLGGMTPSSVEVRRSSSLDRMVAAVAERLRCFSAASAANEEVQTTPTSVADSTSHYVTVAKAPRSGVQGWLKAPF